MRIPPVVLHIALFAYLAMIFFLSSLPGDDLPKIGFEYSDKLVHAAVYFVLTILFFYSLKYQSKSVKLRRNAILFSGVFASVYGLSDEIHQFFVPMRSCEFLDWVADAAGAALAMLLLRRFQVKIEMSVAILLFTMLVACNSGNKTADKNSLNAQIRKEECWIDHMPVLDKTGPRLGFLIEIVAADAKEPIKVSGFKISRSGGEFQSKPFEVMPESIVDGKRIISVTQARDTQYFNDELKESEELQFRINLKDAGGTVKTLTTSKIKPLKVY